MGRTPLPKSLRHKAESVKRAERWLRLLVEQPIYNGGYGCPGCGGFTVLPAPKEQPLSESKTGNCPWCETALVPLDEAFWRGVSDSIRRAWRRDPALLSRIKAESSGYPAPRWPGPLSWIADAWQRAGKPPGKPFKGEQHYLLDFFMRTLKQPSGFVGIEEDKDEDRWKEHLVPFQGGLGLTPEEALDVLSETEFPRGGVTIEGKTYAGLPGKVLNALSKKIRELWGSNLPEARDIARSLSWVRRQRKEPLARLNGERVRAREPKAGK